MGTDRKELVKGLKYTLSALPLLIAGPVFITLGFKAHTLQGYYGWLILGSALALSAILLGVLGIRR
ncbi:MAG: DUF6095 family protein, partial [Lutibacter sp.]|nr:DUF6095 family protein [Lutibacter sp.]